MIHQKIGSIHRRNTTQKHISNPQFVNLFLHPYLPKMGNSLYDMDIIVLNN